MGGRGGGGGVDVLYFVENASHDTKRVTELKIDFSV